ncbi:MAG TPA: hypothetical protein VM598_00820 [Bdellovibrionota bacterium]|nr:hypothetical protein [Bdellovibrionota bacterium]
MIRSSFKDLQAPVVIIGDGWAALGAVRFLISAQAPVVWIQGNGARILPALPALAHGAGAEAWITLARDAGIELSSAQSGCFLREFRNKAFREPLWTKAPTPESREEALREVLWGPERAFTGAFETRFELTIAEIEEKVRAGLLEAPAFERIEGLPVTEIKVEKGAVSAVVLGSGREIACSQVIHADPWSQLPTIAGLPKALPFARKREPMGVLQAVFQHHEAVAADVAEGFFTSLHKEAGEESERHVFGYFLDGGMRSVWSTCLAADEIEDNHAIAKKLRRMKNAIDKMFAGPGWLKDPEKAFMTNVRSEQVRFEGDVVFAEGEPTLEAQAIPTIAGFSCLTDGYGPSRALAQVVSLLLEPPQPEAQAEGMQPVPAQG